jgi:inorganic pyrophosphatase
MVDSEEGDQKVLAVPTRNPRYDQIHTMDQIFSHVRRETRRAIVDSRQRYLGLLKGEEPTPAMAAEKVR